MKKLIYISMIIFFVTGCFNLSNTPIKKTEEFLKKYQTLDNAVIEDLNNVVNNEQSFSQEQKDKYKDIMKKHYQNIKYKIKQDEINGDDAKVIVEIEVTNFSKVLNETEEYLNNNKDLFKDDFGNYDSSKYIDYRLNKLNEAKEKITYTIDIHLIKKDKNWQVKTPSDEVLDKINGIYK